MATWVTREEVATWAQSLVVQMGTSHAVVQDSADSAGLHHIWCRWCAHLLHGQHQPQGACGCSSGAHSPH